MDEKDILDMLYDKDEDMSELIDAVDSIIDMVKIDPNEFMSNLRYALIDKCKEEDCCPECGAQLEVVDTQYECRGEFWGHPVREAMYTYGCTNCNYIEE